MIVSFRRAVVFSLAWLSAYIWEDIAYISLGGGGLYRKMQLCILLVSFILYEVFLHEVDIFGRRV